jgi:hypothetical protein
VSHSYGRRATDVALVRFVVSFNLQYKGSRDDGPKASDMLSHFVCRIYLSMKLCVLIRQYSSPSAPLTHSALADGRPKDDDLDSAIKS